MVDWLQKIYNAVRGEDEYQPFSTAPHTVNTDASINTTRHKIGIAGTIISVDIQGLEGGLSRAELYVRLTLVDRDNAERATLAYGYYDSSGHSIGGIGAIAVRADDQIQIQSWGVAAQTIRARGQILPGVQKTGGWQGTSENSLDGVGRIVLTANETPNSSDKTISIPTNIRAKIKSIWVEYTANATVGTRTVEVHIRDTADDIIGGFRLGDAGLVATQTLGAWLGTGIAKYGQDAINTALAGAPTHQDLCSLPDIPLKQGYDIRVVDTAAIAADTDDMVLQVVTEQWIEET